ncbi:MAG: hypothetical protein WD342_01340 [Verrucomicrobiales bacterium]
MATVLAEPTPRGKRGIALAGSGGDDAVEPLDEGPPMPDGVVGADKLQSAC